jgi:hypothetical protein
MLINKVGILQYKNLVDMSEEGGQIQST